MVRIVRLSLFNIRKHRFETLSLILLIFICVAMMGSSLGIIDSARGIIPHMMEKTGCVPNFLLMDRKEYDPLYLSIIGEDEDVSECGTVELLFSMESRLVDKQGDQPSEYMMFADLATEERLERFLPETKLSDEEIAKLDHPVWLPLAVRDSAGYKEGESFRVILKGVEFPFKIAGFYESGIYDLPGNGLKLVVSDDDALTLAGLVTHTTMLWYRTKDGGGSVAKLLSLIGKLEEVTQRNVADKLYLTLSYQGRQGSAIEVLLYITVAMAVIIFISVAVMIRHRIAEDIENRVVSIGVLEALGYTFGDISLSYVVEYVMLSAAGILLGIFGAAGLAPVLFGLDEVMLGHSGVCRINGVSLGVAALGLLTLVTAIALGCAARVKKYPPVTALRGGIGAHHFGHDCLPLENTKGSALLRLSIKGFFANRRQNIGGGVCIAVSAFTIIACCILYGYIGDDLGVLKAFGGVEISDVQLVLTRQADTYAMADELRSMEEVRKVLINGTTGGLKWEGVSISPVVYDDYSRTESIKVMRGRYPTHDNEVMLPNLFAKRSGKRVGDTITLSAAGVECDYLVTGISTGLLESGVYLTGEGYRQLKPADRPYIIELYLSEGVDREAFMSKLTALYGQSAADAGRSENNGGSYEERIRAEAGQKIGILMEQYGVDHIDYAIMSGDTLISGSSRGFCIKETVSVADLVENSLASTVAAITAAVRVFMVIMAIVIMVVLSMLMESSVRDKRRELGIMKSLGYTSRQLMLMLAVRIMPAAAIATAAGTLLSVLAAKLFTDIFGKIPIDIGTVLAADMAVLAFCFICAYRGARRIKNISVCELMTE